MEHRHPQSTPPQAQPGPPSREGAMHEGHAQHGTHGEHGHAEGHPHLHAHDGAGQERAGRSHDEHPRDHDHDHGHGHGHHHHGPGGHSHVPTEIRHEKPLWWALGLTATVLAAEAVGAWMTNSLALLSDAAHMATDTLALAIALVAVRLARRPPDARRTYGYARFEALGALANGALLFLLAGYILWEAWQRFLAPLPVASMGMLGVAVIGLACNLLAMKLL